MVDGEGGGGDEFGDEVVAGGGVADDEDLFGGVGERRAVEFGVDDAAGEFGDVFGEAFNVGDLGVM